MKDKIKIIIRDVLEFINERQLNEITDRILYKLPTIRDFLIENRKIWTDEEWKLIRMKWFQLEEKADEKIEENNK